MNPVNTYIQDVMGNIHAPLAERQRFETDLRSHLEEAQVAGEDLPAILNQMGSPQEVAAEFMAQVHLDYAGFGRRLVAFIIDMAIILLIAGVLAFSAIALSNLVPQNPTGLGYVISTLIILMVFGCGLGGFAVLLAYFPVLEGRFGQTPGKGLLKLRVLAENGLPIGYKEALLRRLSFYFEMLPVDALFIPFTEKHQRGFDIIARTIVIQE
jgi:uncharacterized RDD family membrane protein YckC